MKKLSLSLDDLRVDTFETSQDQAGLRGTVKALSETDALGCVTGISCDQTYCSCSDALETCAQMGCPLSYHTDCHRCW